MFTYTVPNELNARLNVLVEREGTSRDGFMQEALTRYIEDLEDIYDAELVLSNIHAGKEKTIPYSEVRKDCDLES